MPLTRRDLIASSGTGLAAGGAATVLSACGGEERDVASAEGDVELLGRALDAEATLVEVYDLAAGQQLARPVDAAVTAFAAQASDHVALLTAQIEAAGGPPSEGSPGEAQGESVVEAIRAALEDAVATQHEIVATLSTPGARRAVYEVMAADAAQLAAIRGVLGEDQVPSAFVTGGPEPPLGTAQADEG